jgi:hypothetical protein
MFSTRSGGQPHRFCRHLQPEGVQDPALHFLKKRNSLGGAGRMELRFPQERGGRESSEPSLLCPLPVLNPENLGQSRLSPHGP